LSLDIVRILGYNLFEGKGTCTAEFAIKLPNSLATKYPVSEQVHEAENFLKTKGRKTALL
jgi:hypothetical protein